MKQYKMNRKRIINALTICILLSGFAVLGTACTKETADCTVNANANPLTDLENDPEYIERINSPIIGAEEFVKYYNMPIDKVPLEFLDDYIWENQITVYEVEHDEIESYRMHAVNAYYNGESCGKNLERIFYRNPSSDLPLEDFMKNADVILMDFHTPGPDYLLEPMLTVVVDLENKKIYSKGPEDPYSCDDYTKMKKSADLSDEDIEKISEELPLHIKENIPPKNYSELPDYFYEIKIKAKDHSAKVFEGYQGANERFPGFDDYWEELYEKYFGEK